MRSDEKFEFTIDDSNGCLIGPDGCDYDTKQEAMYFALLASCGCGQPERVHEFVVECVKQFAGEDWPKPGLNAIQAIIEKDPAIAAEFMAHYLAGEAFTEHGSSVYGSWLTDRGKQFIEIGPMSSNHDKHPKDEKGLTHD